MDTFTFSSFNMIWLYTSCFVSFLITLHSLRNGKLNLTGALFAFIIGAHVFFTSFLFTITLLAFFFSSSALTKFRSSHKAGFDLEYRGGIRNASQVLCSGLVPVIVCLFYLSDVGSGSKPINFLDNYSSSMLSIFFVSAIACCNGDTWASEIGSVMGSYDPWHIIKWRSVPRGTNGAISITGTIASVAGGFFIGMSYLLTCLFLGYSLSSHFFIVVVATIAGFLGSLLDSLLGGILQYSGYHMRKRKVSNSPGVGIKHIGGLNLLSNEMVNLFSSITTACICTHVAFLTWPI